MDHNSTGICMHNCEIGAAYQSQTISQVLFEAKPATARSNPQQQQM